MAKAYKTAKDLAEKTESRGMDWNKRFNQSGYIDRISEHASEIGAKGLEFGVELYVRASMNIKKTTESGGAENTEEAKAN